MKNKLMAIALLLSLIISSDQLRAQTQSCEFKKTANEVQLLCGHVDDILCKDVPKADRRGCHLEDQSVIHKNMKARELYEFARGCFQTSVTSFTQFFTEFIPELIKGIWQATVASADGSLWEKLKGQYESIASLTADLHEAVREDPGAYFAHIWEKIIATTSQNIANFDCLKPQLKVERTCAFVAGWLMPPAILAKFLVKGYKAVKHLDLNAGKQRLKLALEKSEKAHPPLALKEINHYKSLFAKEPNLPVGSNQKFIELMKADAQLKKRILYFDVENAAQKKLNDLVLRDKGLVDAINNSYMQKLLDNLKNNPELMSRLQGSYKDYKSLRLRLELKEGDDPVKFQKMLADLQIKTSDDFKSEFEKMGMNKTIPPITDEAADPGRWFLAGIGESSLEANMAARGARSDPRLSVIDYKTHVHVIDRDIREIEVLRKELQKQSDLLKSGILTQTPEGIIPSKEMIEILRKNKPDNFSTPEEYVAKIKNKTETLFGKTLNDSVIADLTSYFQKVDSLSPPLFTAERTLVNLQEAKKGIVSIDFAGAGVNNAFEQMRALVSQTSTKSPLPASSVLSKVQTHVDSVTDQMNKGKTVFDKNIKQATKESHAPLFSGDDGIFLPKTALTLETKTNLVQKMGQQNNPSQFRVTFVHSEYENGKSIPAKERSKKIAEAESVEKKLRELVTGKNLIPPEKAKELMFAIDYNPKETGGTFNLIIGGKKPTSAELKMISDAFSKTLNSAAGELTGKIIVP